MNVIVTYIDIKNSSSIKNLEKKKSLINSFYKSMNRISVSDGGLSIRDKLYLGDGVIIFCNANKLTKHDLLDFLKSINKETTKFENDNNEILKIGMGYGKYGDVQISTKFDQKSIYVAPCFDFSAKGSDLAKSNSIPEKYVVIGNKTLNIEDVDNQELIKLLKTLHEEGEIIGVESTKSKNYRYEVKDE